jgi:hypothetical protein
MAIFMAIFLWLFLLTAVLSGFFPLLPLFLAVSLYCCSFWLFLFTAVISQLFLYHRSFVAVFHSSFFMISYLLFQYFFKLSGIQ